VSLDGGHGGQTGSTLPARPQPTVPAQPIDAWRTGGSSLVQPGSADRADSIPETWSWPVPFELTSVRAARQQVSDLLEARGVAVELIDDACSVMSELVANALRHATPLPDGQLEINVVVGDDAVVLAVADGGGAGTIPSVVSPAPLARSGRGLGIVHTLTSDWGVRESDDGNTVFDILSRA
jgi:serine/threonine-protein kinase RsbW